MVSYESESKQSKRQRAVISVPCIERVFRSGPLRRVLGGQMIKLVVWRQFLFARVPGWRDRLFGHTHTWRYIPGMEFVKQFSQSTLAYRSSGHNVDVSNQ